MNERWKTFAWAAALFYVVLLAFNWSALTRRADLQTKSMLDFAMLDYVLDLEVRPAVLENAGLLGAAALAFSLER